MTPLQFLSAVWPDQGFYCLAIPFKPEGSTKTVYAHKTFKTIRAAAQHAERRSADTDVFFSVFTLEEEQVWDQHKTNYKTGEKGAYAVRIQSNMRESRCFFFDLDVGDDAKKYATQIEAMVALRDFCKETKLPKPLVTSSGGGLHVYWRMTDPLFTEDWVPYAEKLKALAVSLGLRADPMRTTDTSSVLRVAGTFNYKKDQKRPVKVLMEGDETETSEMLAHINRAFTSFDLSIKTKKKFKVQSDNFDWGNNLDANVEGRPPPSLDTVLETCAEMKRVWDTNGNVSEPEWYAALGVLYHTENGIEHCHTMSSGYPDYDADEVNDKLSRWQGKGFPLCSTIRDRSGGELCGSCKFKNRNSNPISIAQNYQHAPPPELPVHVTAEAKLLAETIMKAGNFKRVKDGIIMIAKNSENEDGEDEVIRKILPDIDLFPLRRNTNDMKEREQQLWRAKLPRNIIKDFTIDADALYDRRKFASSISNAGLFPSNGDIPHVQEYMLTYIRELQKLADLENQSNHFGWTDKHTKFVLPEKIITAEGVTPAAMSESVMEVGASMTKEGSLLEQVRLLDFYNDDFYLPQQFFIMAHLAAPIFWMTGFHGCVVNAYGMTGASKSTALYTGASFWGNPDHYALNGTKRGSTVNYRNEKMVTLANLPICVDEITHIPADEAADMAMFVSQPDGRRRLTQKGDLKKTNGAEKATMMMTTSNASIHGLLSQNNVSGTASSMRLFEIHCKKYGPHSKSDADEYLFQLRENYGHIGEAFIMHVIKNVETIKMRVREVMRYIDQRASLESGERFWGATVAAVVVATEIAYELRLCSFSSVKLLNWGATTQIDYQRNVVKEEYATPVTILTDYLELINGDILVVSRSEAHPDFVSVEKVPRGALLGRYEKDVGSMILLKKSFADHCVRIGANASQVLRDLASIDDSGTRIVTNTQYRATLGRGTQHEKAQSWCFVVNMNHPEMKGKSGPSEKAEKPGHLRIVK
jgi:hypothetical protein